MTERGVAPVIGIVTMVLITVVLAALVGGMFFGVGLENPPEASIVADATYDGANGTTRVSLTHRSGDRLDVTDLTVRVAINGEPLEHQPTVPDVGMDGFRHAPSGPFNGGNGSTDTVWTAGEVAGFEIAGTNEPIPTPGDRLTVRIFADGHPVVVRDTIVR